MELTKQRKILLATLGIGAAVFAADRMFLGGGPEAADAAAVAAEQHALTPTAAPRVASPSPVLPGVNENTIARRLSRYAESTGLQAEGVREAFVPPRSWVPPVQEKAEAAPAAPKVDPRSTFLEAHRLSAVMGNGESALAIVNDTPIRVGQEYQGFVLVEVTPRSAWFASSAGRVELKLSR